MFLVLVCAQLASLGDVETLLLGLPASVRQFVLVFLADDLRPEEVQRRLRHQGAALPVRVASSGLPLHHSGIYLVPSGFAVSQRNDILWLEEDPQPLLQTLHRSLRDAARLVVILMSSPAPWPQELHRPLWRLRQQGALLLAQAEQGRAALEGVELDLDHVAPARAMGELLRYHGALRSFLEEVPQGASAVDGAWLAQLGRDALLGGLLPPRMAAELRYLRHALQQGQRRLEEAQAARDALQQELEHMHQAQRTLQHLMERQRRDLDTLLQQGQEALVLLDGDLRVRRYTSAVQRWIRLLPQDEGRPLTHVVFDLPRPPVFGVLQEALRNNSPALRHVVEDGEEVEIWAWPDSREGVVLALRPRDPAPPRDSDLPADLGALLGSLITPALVLDHERSVVLCNRAAELFFGQALGRLSGRRLDQLLVGEDLERVWSLCRQALRGQGLPMQLELQNGRMVESLGGQPRYIRGQMLPCPLPGAEGEESQEAGVLWLFEDLSHEQQAQRLHLHQQSQILEAHNLERLRDWTAGLAHDVNNLLTVALTNLHILAQGEELDAQERAELLEESSQVTRGVRDLIRDSIPHGLRPRQLELLSLNEVVRHQEPTLRTVIPDGVDFQMDLCEELPLVFADVHQLGRIGVNLVRNAVEALTQEGDRLVMLATGVQRLHQSFCQEYPYRPDLQPGDYVFLEVSDTGRGIDPEVLPNLFKPRVTTHQEEGRGWGLANVLQLVHEMNGAVEVFSTQGAGSTFLIYLPALLSAEEEQRQHTPWPGTSPEAPLPGRGERLVLYIDDDRRLQRSVARLLQQHHFRVEAATGGREGLRLCREFDSLLSAVVLDLTMPDMDGLEVLRHLRLEQPWLPVILVSGYSERMDELPLDERTCFLEKPLLIESLVPTLDRMVALGHGTLSR